MKEDANIQVTTPATEAALVKPDTSANLTRYEIWYQDTSNPSLWHSRSGNVINAEDQGDFYHDVLQMVQIVFPLNICQF